MNVPLFWKGMQSTKPTCSIFCLVIEVNNQSIIKQHWIISYEYWLQVGFPPKNIEVPLNMGEISGDINRRLAFGGPKKNLQKQTHRRRWKSSPLQVVSKKCPSPFGAMEPLVEYRYKSAHELISELIEKSDHFQWISIQQQQQQQQQQQ